MAYTYDRRTAARDKKPPITPALQFYGGRNHHTEIRLMLNPIGSADEMLGHWAREGIIRDGRIENPDHVRSMLSTVWRTQRAAQEILNFFGRLIADEPGLTDLVKNAPLSDKPALEAAVELTSALRVLHRTVEVAEAVTKDSSAALLSAHKAMSSAASGVLPLYDQFLGRYRTR